MLGTKGGKSDQQFFSVGDVDRCIPRDGSFQKGLGIGDQQASELLEFGVIRFCSVIDGDDGAADRFDDQIGTIQRH